MLYITGDTHAEFQRFSTDNFPQQRLMTKDDYVIICGDFGLWHDTPNERYWLKWLNEKPFTTLFVDGNHSNFDRIYQMPVNEWHGGQVHYVRDSVIHLMRGQVFEIAGKRVFTMGGASSHDISGGILEPDDPHIKLKRKALSKKKALYRTNHLNWWKEELPSDAEYEVARQNLDACGWKVDYIITHCCPSSIAEMIAGDEYPPDRLTDFFMEVKDHCTFDRWFFGHYHDNQTFMEKYELSFMKIKEIQL